MPDLFRERLVDYFDDLKERVTTADGVWTVKGFIDIYKRVYTVSLDTKVLSKVLELLMFPVISRFAHENGFEIVLARAQNQYPDLSLVSLTDNTAYAIDVKTTYRKGSDRNGQIKVNGMTLGTFQGYFRNRESARISTFPYNRYTKHYVLGVVYTQVENIDERNVYHIDELEQIPSVAKDFEFFFHEKYRIAADRPGSGNTKNIGSTVYLNRLMEGTGVFSALGVEIFDDYWMNYQTKGMAGGKPPYSNLKEYRLYKETALSILDVPLEAIETESGEEDDENEE